MASPTWRSSGDGPGAQSTIVSTHLVRQPRRPEPWVPDPEFPGVSNYQAPFDAAQQWFAGDFNGDGLTDLVDVRNQGGNLVVDFHVNVDNYGNDLGFYLYSVNRSSC